MNKHVKIRSGKEKKRVNEQNRCFQTKPIVHSTLFTEKDQVMVVNISKFTVLMIVRFTGTICSSSF